MKTKRDAGLFTKAARQSPFTKIQCRSVPHLMTPKIAIDPLDDFDQSLDNYGLVRHIETPGKFKTATKKTSLVLSTDLETQNRQLRSKLLEKQLAERKYIERILELEHEVMTISNQLVDIRKNVDKKIKDDRKLAGSAASRLQSLSLIQYSVPSVPTVKKVQPIDDTLDRIIEMVMKEVGLFDRAKVYPYLKCCVKFTERVRDSIGKLLPVRQKTHCMEIKQVWRHLKAIVSQWQNQREQ